MVYTIILYTKFVCIVVTWSYVSIFANFDYITHNIPQYILLTQISKDYTKEQDSPHFD